METKQIIKTLRSHDIAAVYALIDEIADKVEELDVENQILLKKVKSIPCDVGDLVYRPWHCNGHKTVAKFYVTRVSKTGENKWDINYQSFHSKDWKRPVVRHCSSVDLGTKVFLSSIL